MFEGKVVWMDAKKGYGFISPNDPKVNDGKDLFVHWSNLEMEGFKRLEPDQVVMFELGDNGKGPQAIKVKVKE